MQFTFAKACLLALAATTSVFAQIDGFDVLTAPTKDEVVKAGKTYTIKWVPTNPAGPISLILMQGTNNITLQLAEGFIAESIDSTQGQFDWAVPTDASFPTYGIKLQLDSDHTIFQYSNYFTISGGAAGGAGNATESSIAGDATSGGSTKTVQVSQVSTPSPTSTRSTTHSSSAKPTPTKEAPSTTAESTTAAPSTTEAPSTTMDTSTVAPSSTEAPSTSPTASPTGAANSNAVVGSGLLGAMVLVFALF